MTERTYHRTDHRMKKPNSFQCFKIARNPIEFTNERRKEKKKKELKVNVHLNHEQRATKVGADGVSCRIKDEKQPKKTASKLIKYNDTNGRQ